MQLGFRVLLICCHLLNFLGFLPPTPFFPPWAGGGGNVQYIYLYSVSKARKRSFNRQPGNVLLGCQWYFRKVTLTFSLEASSVVWGSFHICSRKLKFKAVLLEFRLDIKQLGEVCREWYKPAEHFLRCRKDTYKFCKARDKYPDLEWCFLTDSVYKEKAKVRWDCSCQMNHLLCMWKLADKIKGCSKRASMAVLACHFSVLTAFPLSQSCVCEYEVLIA